MKYKHLIHRSKNPNRALRLIYFLSERIKTPEDYVLLKEEEIDFCPNEFQKYMESEKPIERITGEVHFYGFEFILLDKVFCPRNETEMVVEALLEKIEVGTKYIDICCGSGVIGISTVLKGPKISAHFLDIDELAVENTRKNLSKHCLKAEIIRGDWLEHLKNNDYETISANFPYIGHSDEIDESILKYDPKIALFSENDGWYHYGKLLEHLETNNSWKLVVLECSSLHVNRWTEMAKKHSGWSVEFKRDLSGHLRVAIIRNKSQF